MTTITNEDTDLQYTRDKRIQLVEAITKKGTSVPEDIKDRSILLSALDGIDKAALAKKKIKSDEGISNSQVAAAAIIAEIYTTKNVRALAIDTGGVIPLLNNTIPDAAVVYGELDTVSEPLNYDTFISKF